MNVHISEKTVHTLQKSSNKVQPTDKFLKFHL